MRRRRHQQSEAGVTLFPFMAVLICTMGTMIVLLVIVVRQAKVRADTMADEQVAQRRAAADESEIERLRMEQEDAQSRVGVLKQSRDEMAADLGRQSLQLAHIEDHTRRLEDEVKQLARQKHTLDALSRTRVLDSKTVEAELDKLTRRVQQERDALEETRREVAEQPRSYAIIPYEGPNGTRRRPIYIECRSDRVILQPEGIVLSATDFRRPLGPGNPLASSLRAIREYWARASGPEGGGEPYPLLIVRPDGADAYSRCREAMESWDDEFGYELVSSDISLAFPPADPGLTALLERTLDEARRYHNAIVLAARSRLGAEEQRPYLRAAPSGGGFVMEGAPERFGENRSEPGGFGSGGASDAGGFGRNGQPGASESFAAARQGGGGSDDGSATPFGGSSTHAGPDRSGRGGETAQPGYGGTPIGQGQPGHAGAQAGQGQPGHGGASIGPGQPPQNAAQAGQEQPGHSGAQVGQGQPWQSGTQGGQSEQSVAAATGSPGGPFRQSGMGPSMAGPAGVAGQQPGTFGASSGQCDSGGCAGAESLPNMAELRGRNWALPNAARGATGATRPIRIICTARQLTIIPGQHSGEVLKTVALQGATMDALDEFVSALWQHIEDWGPAGTGMYWKPILRVEVAPGGEKRFDQLKHLLDDSGIQVQQKAR